MNTNKSQNKRQSKSSNQESFEALNEYNDKISHHQDKSRPSQSSDFDSCNDKYMSGEQISQKKEQNENNFVEQLETLQKILVSNQKSVQQQLQIIKFQYHQKQKEISLLQSQICSLKKRNSSLEQNFNFYKEECQRLNKVIKQYKTVSNSFNVVSQKPQFLQIDQNTPFQIQKDFTKKKSSKLSSQKQMSQKLNQYEAKISSLNAKIQLFIEQDKKVRQFFQRYLKYTPTFNMQLSTLIQSAIIELDSQLKQLNRQIENIILDYHLQNSHKIHLKRQNFTEIKYNHWETLSNLEHVKNYVELSYKNKIC